MDSTKAVRFEVLTPVECETLGAIADRIFPKTDTPGAVEIGVLNYIDIALAGDYAPFVPLSGKGFRPSERLRKENLADVFPIWRKGKRDAVLGDSERGWVRGLKKAAEFFETVRYHVLEGVFCEPQYGGNKEMIGWRLVNFPGQQFGYADAYVNKRVDLQPIAVDYTKVDKE